MGQAEACYNIYNCDISDRIDANGPASVTISGNNVAISITYPADTKDCGKTTNVFTFHGTLNGNTISASSAAGYFSITGSPKLISYNTNESLGCPTCADPGAGNPISIGTGNKYEEVTDYSTAAANPLNFTRYYNSMGSASTRAIALGVHWRSTYDRYLRISAGSIIAERADGQELNFVTNNGAWTSDSDVDVQLLQSGASWTLINSDDTVETYASSGLLTSIQARDGYTQTMSYNSSNQLATVTDSFNRKLQLAYQSNLLHTVTAPDGLILTYGYNSSGVTPGVLDRLASVAYSTTPQTSQSYLYENSGLPFALTGIIDENGNRYATWAYDSTGRAISSQHANGADLTTVTYNADGSRDVTDASGLTEVYIFTILQGVPKVTQINRLATASVPAATMAYTYDTNGYIASVVDWNTNLTTLVNDIHDQPVIISEAIGTAAERSTTASYLPNFHLPLQIVAPRETTGFAYDAHGNLLTLTETDTTTGSTPYSTAGETRMWTNTYDSFGHVLMATGPRTDVIAITTNTYDLSNNLVRISDPLGHVTRLTNYNGSGLPLMMVDANDVTNRFSYDVRNRLLTRTVQAASGIATNTFGYDAAGLLASITLPNGTRLSYQYDAAHRLQSVTNSLGESIAYLLDAAGNITNQTVRSAGSSIVKRQSAVFDNLSRMLEQIGASSQITRLNYDNNGNRISTTDGLANTTTRAFDALNRLVSIIDPLTAATGLQYDEQNNLVSVSDPRSLVTSYFYDGFGRVIEENSPDKGITEYAVDAAGNRTEEFDARGYYTYRTFDKLNRMTTETFMQSTGENTTNTYDSTTGGNFGIGRLTGYIDESGGTTLKYNERGDVVSTTHTIYGQPYTINYGYDIADNLTNITYPSGHIISYKRDSQGRVNTVAYRPSTSGTATMLATNVAYMPFGPVAAFLYGNGLRRTNQFDGDYRLTGITTTAGTTNIQNLSLAYNNANNIIAIADNLASTRNQGFAYDPDYRLTQATGLYGADKYTYDTDGNRLTRTAENVTETYNYSQTANQLLSVVKPGVTRNFTYTANGNVYTDNRGTTTNLTFIYYGRNRYNYLSINSSNAAFYSYNAFGERTYKRVYASSTIIHYQYDERGHLIAESLPNGAMIREYVWLDDMPLAQIENSGAIYFIHPDHLNRPQKITDANRNIVWDNEQQPFGEATPTAVTPVGYSSNRQFQITINAAPNNRYILQGTTNLSKPVWVSLATNSAPFSYADISAATNRTRFYRILVATNVNIASVTNNLRFPGQYYDAEFGLNYNMMRDYDSTAGRYVQGDPIGLESGINVYGYVDGNPLSIIDSQGLIGASINIGGSALLGDRDSGGVLRGEFNFGNYIDINPFSMSFLESNSGVSATAAVDGYYGRMFKNSCPASDPDPTTVKGVSASPGLSISVNNANSIDDTRGEFSNIDITFLILNIQYAGGYNDAGKYIFSYTIGDGFGLSYSTYKSNTRILNNTKR